MKKSLFLDFTREIKNSFNRFISIFLIVALGAGFFAGVYTTGDDMKATLNKYYKDYNYMDMEVMSNYGFTDDDINAMNKIEDVKVYPAYQSDLILSTNNKDRVVRVHSYDEKSDINKFVLKEGRLPESENECLMEYLQKPFTNEGSKIAIGDKIKLSVDGEDDKLEDILGHDEYEIVGTIETPMYISRGKGNTNIGSGTIDYFMFVPMSEFKMDIYTSIVFDIDKDLYDTFGKEYTEFTDELTIKMEDLSKTEGKRRKDEVVSEINEKIDDAKKELDEKVTEAEEKITDGKKELSDGRKKYNDGIKEYNEQERKFYSEIEDAEKKLSDAKLELQDGEKEYEDAIKTLYDGWVEFNKQKEKADKEIPEAEEDLEDARIALDVAKLQLKNGEDQLNAAKKEYESKKQELDNGKAKIESAKSISNGITYLISNAATMTPDEVKSMSSKLSEFDSQLGTLVETYVTMVQGGVPGVSVIEGQLNGVKDNIDNEVSTNQQIIDAGQTALYEAKAHIESAEAEYNEKYALYVDGLDQYEKGMRELEKIKFKLKSAEDDLNDGTKKANETQTKLDDGWQSYNTGIVDLDKAKEEGPKKLSDARKELADAKQKLLDGQKEIKDAEEELKEETKKAERKIRDAEVERDDLKDIKWTITPRNEMANVVGYKDNAERIDAISVIFPVFFFAIAALVCLTTMTRMVEENRVQIGSLKALGYSEWDIAKKYVYYAFFATALGAIFGLLVGYQLFPKVIYSPYKSMVYVLPPIQTPFKFGLGAITFVVCLICTIGATSSSLLNTLKEQPANLLRPVAPKAGKRILLERIPVLWNRLSFSWKVTMRNLFRYKKRMLMSVVGIAGCTALMLTGFGIRDSIDKIAPMQFEEIFTYDASVMLNENGEDFNDVTRTMDEESNITDYMFTHSGKAKSYNKNLSRDTNVNTYIIENPEHFTNFIQLQDLDGNKIKPNNNGVIITDKLSQLHKIKKGDMIDLTIDDEEYEVPVEGVVRNYTFHYVFMTEDFYKSLTGEETKDNQILISFDNTKNLTLDEQQVISKKLISSEYVITSILNEDINQSLTDQMKSLDIIVYVLIVSASVLAFVVMYNLTNININERMREIATLKVLGFYPPETSSYIFRENMLLSIMGSGVGMVLGKLLTNFIITAVELDDILFLRIVRPQSYLYAFLLTMLFTLIVRFIMSFTIDKINMVESLKSVE